MEAKALLQKLLDDMERGNNVQTARIRKGAQGSVVKVRDNGGREIALKIIDYGGRPDIDIDRTIQNLKREYKSLKRLSHPSIVRFQGFEHHPDVKKAYIKMEWATSALAESAGEAIDLGDLILHHNGGDNGGVRSYLPESFIWHVLFHLSAALALCHHGIQLHRKLFPEHADSTYVLSRLIDPPQRLRELARSHPRLTWQTERITFSAHKDHEPIVHRDIKPRNILLSDPPFSEHDKQWRTEQTVTLDDGNQFSVYPTVLLGDFGISAPLRDARTQGIGTFGYTAPEVPAYPWKPYEPEFVWSIACDIFSLGTTVAHLMSLERPAVYRGAPGSLPNLPDHYSRALRGLVSQCCSSENTKRPTSIKILDTCISRAAWRQTYVTPYGSLISSNFSAEIKNSWHNCLKVISPDFTPLANESGPEKLIPRALDILALSSRKGELALSMLIAGAYQTRHFGLDAKRFLHWPQQDRFIGRQDILQELRMAMYGDINHTTAILHGLGGIGKTQIAIQFTYEEMQRDPGLSVFWVNGMSISVFEESYRQIASLCGASTSGDVDTELMQRVKNWLESPLAGRWLLVIDNVDDVPVFRKKQLQFVPKNQYGFTIYTSRDRGLAGYLEEPIIIPVSCMSDKESVELVRSVIPDKKLGDAEELVASLENHPLAISQALAFVKNLGMTLEEYLHLLLSKPKDKERLLGYEFVSPGRQRGMESLRSTWIVSLNELEKRTPLAIDVLSLMSFFDPNRIPVSLIAKEYKDKLEFSEALSALRAFSLVNVNHDGSAYTVHPLVQLVTRDWALRKRPTSMVYLRALRLLCLHFPEYQKANWKESFELLPHVDEVLAIEPLIYPSSEIDLARAELMIKATPFFTKKGKLETAEGMARKALMILPPEKVDNSEIAGKAESNIAGVLLAAGKYGEAHTYAENALRIMEKAVGPSDVQTINTLGLLGLVMQSLGDYSEALAIHRKELSLRSDSIGQPDYESPEFLNSLMNLGSVLYRKGEYEEAEEKYRQTLHRRRKLLGPEHPDTLICQSDLSVSLQHQGKLPEALELQEESVRRLEAIFGQDSLWSMKALARLASIKKDAEDLPGSESAYTKALEIMRRILGEEHPETLECLADLGNVYFLEGKADLAESTIQSSIETSRRVLGSEHPQFLSMMKRMAMFLQSQQRIEEAETIYRQVLASRQRILGAKHPDTVDSISDVISVLSDQGREQEAADLALELSEQTTSEDSPNRHDAHDTHKPSRILRSSRFLSLERALEEESKSGGAVLRNTFSSRDFPDSHELEPDINQINKGIIDRKRKGRKLESLVDDFMLETISRRDHLFIIDNSLSMQRHWDEVKVVFRALSYIIGMGDNDAVELRMGPNHSKTSELEDLVPLWSSDREAIKHFRAALSNFAPLIERPEGKRSPFGTSTRFRRREYHIIKPLTIYILTDGISIGNFDEIPDLIAHFYHEVGRADPQDKPLLVQFIAFGDELSWQRLRHLDDTLNSVNYGADFDVVDVTPSTGNVRKMLLGPLVDSFDCMPEDDSIIRIKNTSTSLEAPTNEETLSSSKPDHPTAIEACKDAARGARISLGSLTSKRRTFSKRLRERAMKLLRS